MATLYASGTLQNVIHRQGGWVRVEIAEPGKQYPRKLDTKKPEIIQQCQMMIGQVVTAMYNEIDSGNPNPHRPGTNYINRYLEQITLGWTDVSSLNPPVAPAPQPVMQPQAMGQPQPMPMPQPQPQAMQQQPMPVTQQVPPGIPPHVKELRIMREACLGVAASMLPMLDPSEQNLGSLIRVTEQLIKYVEEGVPWDTFPIQYGSGPAQGGNGGPTAEERDAAAQQAWHNPIPSASQGPVGPDYDPVYANDQTDY